MDCILTEIPALGSKAQRKPSRSRTTSTPRRGSLDLSVASTLSAKSTTRTPAVQSSRNTPEEYSGHQTTPESTAQEDHTPTPSKRGGLRHKNKEPTGPKISPVEAAMKPLTDEERRTWPGWVELESEPALFNYILREYGVKDVKVQEVFSLDDEALNHLPKPIYGLIFLFRYWDEDEEEAPELPRCPNYVWFANQTITNACATIALLNIVMNVPKIELGDNLNAYKTETKGLKPPYRGQSLGENEFIRSIHNSFATRMDILNADLSLSNDVDKWNKTRTARKRKGTARKSQSKTAKKKKQDEEEPGFHFIAYVPIKGDVWRLDGMQRQPVNLGEIGKNWIELARENITLRIAQYDTELEFNVMSLCRSPLRNIPEQLAENVHSFSAIEEALNSSLPDWKAFVEVDESFLPLAHEPNESFSVSKELLASSCVSASVQRKLGVAAEDPTMLVDMRRDLLKEQRHLQASYIDEVASIGMENETAAQRKIDYSPVIYSSMRGLAENGVLREIIEDLAE